MTGLIVARVATVLGAAALGYAKVKANQAEPPFVPPQKTYYHGTDLSRWPGLSTLQEGTTIQVKSHLFITSNVDEARGYATGENASLCRMDSHLSAFSLQQPVVLEVEVPQKPCVKKGPIIPAYYVVHNTAVKINKVLFVK